MPPIEPAHRVSPAPLPLALPWLDETSEEAVADGMGPENSEPPGAEKEGAVVAPAIAGLPMPSIDSLLQVGKRMDGRSWRGSLSNKKL